MVPRAEQRSELGTDAYHGGVVYPRHAALHPAKYQNGLLARVIEAGAQVAPYCPVLDIERSAAGFTLRTPHGAITARDVTDETYLKASQQEQLLQAAVDSAGLCQFSNPTAEDMAKFVSAQHGVDWSADDVIALGRRCLKEEREFNLRAGFGRDADELPSFLRTEPIKTPAGDAVFDLPDELIDTFWDDL
ncbi:MAG: FAD-dependent oxidoreductase [Chloroflexi bacterium]|nr:FAD-dependent oxidoreductase [Chloroflexota bacterium]